MKIQYERDDQADAEDKAQRMNDVAWLLKADAGQRILNLILNEFCGASTGYQGETPMLLSHNNAKREVKDRIEQYLLRHQPKLFLGFLEKTVNDEKGV